MKVKDIVSVKHRTFHHLELFKVIKIKKGFLDIQSVDNKHMKYHDVDIKLLKKINNKKQEF